jgi:hypothetical protein
MNMMFFGATLDVVGTPFISEVFPNRLWSKGCSMTLAMTTCTTSVGVLKDNVLLQRLG